ncbi:MAG: hypothetical protein GF331_23930, partial [Chitinivibrionales bacterium]|nr:hypothetical protein [Chitinivibrionales bacterium]
TWKYVNGSGGVQSGSTGGHCSPSLSPDGKSCTGLKNGHDECKLTGFISGGTSGTLRRTLTDCSSKGFDNQRWSSNDPRFIVAQYECDNKVGVWEVGTNDVYLFGDCTAETYGDFTRGAGDGDWPAGQQQDPVMLCDISGQSFSYTIGQTAPSSKTLKVYTEAGTLEGVTKSSTPGWLTVSLGATSGNEITITNSVDINGLAANTYTADVTISSGNAGSVTYRVALTVNAFVAPPAVVLTAPNGGETFFVGQTMTITWEANEDSLTRAEIFVSPNEGENWYAITGTGSVNATDADWESYQWTVTETLEGTSLLGTTVLVMVQDYNEGTGIQDISDAVFSIKQPGAMELKLNLGASKVAVDGWEDAGSYATGGTDYDFNTAFSTSGLNAPAPANVYRTCRHRIRGTETGFSIVLPHVPDGNYLFRFHFADAGGDRAIDVSVNGTAVIEDLDIATDAGGTGNALIIEEHLTVSGGNGVTVVLDDDRSSPADVFMNGLEVLSVSAPTLTAGSVRPTHAAGLRIDRLSGAVVLRVPDAAGSRVVAITDLNGRVVRRMRAGGGSCFIMGTSKLAPGRYNVFATINGRTYSGSFSTIQ